MGDTQSSTNKIEWAVMRNVVCDSMWYHGINNLEHAKNVAGNLVVGNGFS